MSVRNILSLLVLFSVIGFGTPDSISADPYELNFSTYLGGKLDWDQARDVCVDRDGNIFLTGGATSSDFPVTDGAFLTTFDTSGKQVGSGGHCDAFVSKFSKDGELLWSTLLGGSNYDRGYGIEVDEDGYVYVCGRGGPGFPVTAGSVQPTFKGVDAGIYGWNNGFVAKLKPDGSGLVWATYIGEGSLCRDLDIDRDGNVFTHICRENKASVGQVDSSWFDGGFQENPGGGMDQGALKISADGTSVLWATWLSGSRDEQKEASVRVGDDGCPVLLFWTESTDIPTTASSSDQTLSGERDAYVVKVSADGKRLIWATYFGGPGNAGGCGTHNLALDREGNAYIFQETAPGDLAASEGVFASTHAGGAFDCLVAKFGVSSGQLIASIFLGGSGEEEGDGISVDKAGNVYVSGSTNSTDFPVSAGALQREHGGGENDVFFAVISADFKRLDYATYLGGENWDYGRGSCLAPNGDFYVSGSANGTGWPLKDAFQVYQGGGGGKELCYRGGCYAGDVTVAHFRKLGASK